MCIRDRFITLADHIVHGEWLGPYTDLTLVKPIGYPLFIAANYFTGLPLKMGELLFYQFSCIVLAIYLYKCLSHKWLIIPLVCFLILNPYLEVINRVLREGFYTSLTVLVIAIFVAQHIHIIHKHSKRTLAFSIISGLLLFYYWNTREEGVWILPLYVSTSLLLIATRKVTFKKLLVPYLLTLLVFLCSNFILSQYTLKKYGTPHTVDFLTPEAEEAITALFRINYETEPYVVLPEQIREKLYEVSPSLNSIKKEIEYYASKPSYQCKWHPHTCGKITADKIVWTLRWSIKDLSLIHI